MKAIKLKIFALLASVMIMSCSMAIYCVGFRHYFAVPDTPADITAQAGDDGDIGENNRLHLLARLVKAEAGERTYLEQISLAAVVLNRVGDPAFPDTIAGVIWQNGAFASVDNGTFNAVVPDTDDPVWMQCLSAARLALWGMDPTDGATDLPAV